MTRFIHWIAEVVRDPQTNPEVHFHSGPDSSPAACHDAGCESPRLDV
jgi:hypothetical protein